MDMQNDMNKTPEKKLASESTRRSFMSKAAIGAPIVIASSAKPAWGAACMSGIMSGNVSNHAHTCDLSGGLSHGYWKNHNVLSKNDKIGGKKAERFSKQKPHCLDVVYKFYVKTGRKVYFSDNHCKVTSKIPALGSRNFLQCLTSGDKLEREFVGAILNAHFSDKGHLSPAYPYTMTDLMDILSQVTSENRDEIADLLESLHKNGHSNIV